MQTRWVEAVVFDLDGTLFDHEGSARRGVREFIADLDGSATRSLEDAWFAAEESHVATWMAGGCSWEDQRRRRLREFLPLLDVEVPAADDHLDQLFDRYLTAYESAWAAFDDAMPALEAVRSAGVQVALLTNGKRDQQLSKLRRTSLLHLVGEVWATDDLGAAKPDPTTYLTVCRSLKVPPSHAVYVGDNFAHDVEGAVAAGLQAIYLDRDDRGPRSYRPRIASLDGLPSLVTAGPPEAHR